MHALFYSLNAAALCAILIAWYKITAFRRRIPGGLVKTACNILGEFVGLFAFGFLALMSFPYLPREYREVLISLVFISGAVFSIAIINFFSRLADDSGF